MPEPVTQTELALIADRRKHRIAFYDWEADALTPAGKSVNSELGRFDGAASGAFEISQGTSIEPPGYSRGGGLAAGNAARLVSKYRRGGEGRRR